MRFLLLIFLAFMALTASFSGLTLFLDPDGSLLQMSPGLLTDTPFHDFRIPGLILAFLVGGLSLVAFYYQLIRHRNAFPVTVASGVVMSGWIFIQTILVREYHVMQAVYFMLGILVILVSWQLKGKALF